MQSLKHETQTINADAARIASLRMELIEELNGLGPINSDDPHCLNCKTTENLRDGDECWACYDMRLHDAEMLARHGGDV